MKMHSILSLVLTCLFASSVIGRIIEPKDLISPPKDLYQENLHYELSKNGRITNGTLANTNQIPFQVALTFSSGRSSWFCGGSIIHKNYILTAAHCTDSAKSVSIVMGTVDRNQPKVQVTVAGKYFKQHAAYDNDYLANDISLIQVPDIEFSDSIKPVTLPSKSKHYPSFAGDTCIASGWGKIKDSATSSTDKLQFIPLQIVTNRVCASVYTSLVVRSSVICTDSRNGGSTCSGDSGGPLVLKSTGEQVGVTSFVSSSGCEMGYPSGFTRVTYYLDWIEKQTGMSL